MSSGQRSIRVGKYAMDRGLCLRLVETGVLLALVLAVALLRFQRLDALPPGLVEDEDRDGMGALRVLQGELAAFFPDVDPHGRDASVIYAAALSTLLFGRTLFAMHFPTALGSAGMVLAVFWMGRLLFGRDEEGEQATPWRGLLIGGVGAGLMAISISQTVMGRTSYNHITQLPLLLTLCLGLLWRGWKERSWRRVALAGAFAGLLPYTYPVARFTPVLFVFFGLSFLVPLRAVNWGKVRQELRWAASLQVWPRWWQRRCSSILLCIPNTFFCAANICGYLNLRSVNGARWGFSWPMCGSTLWHLVLTATRIYGATTPVNLC